MFTENACCIFDYAEDSPAGSALKDGVISPAELSAWAADGREIYVFVSHHHADHYSRRIFAWRDAVPAIRYILSSDVWTGEEAVRMKPGETRQVGRTTVRTLKSTDVGVAFLVSLDGITLYHAGDLNWWYWDGEPEEDNRRMERRYKEQIHSLQGERIDVAFLPADPRQEDRGLDGMLYFLNTLQPQYALPMHCWENAAWFERLRIDPALEPYRSILRVMERRGQQEILYLK